MGKTSIEWVARPGTTPKTWNMIGGCVKVSPACDNCYALRQSWRIQNSPKHPSRYDDVVEKRDDGTLAWTGRVNVDADALEKPLSWQEPCTIFVASMADLFYQSVGEKVWQAVWHTMARCPQHTFMVLTKRADLMQRWLSGHPSEDDPYGMFVHRDHPVLTPSGEDFVKWPLPNVWLGVTHEAVQTSMRVQWLLQTPAVLRYLSIEPMLFDDPLDTWHLHKWLFKCPSCAARPYEGSTALSDWRFDGQRFQHQHNYPVGHLHTVPAPLIDWIILGGESGPNARPMDLKVTRDIIAACRDAGVPVFVKQLGTYWAKTLGAPKSRYDAEPGYKGENIEQWPPDLRVREWPQ